MLVLPKVQCLHPLFADDVTPHRSLSDCTPGYANASVKGDRFVLSVSPDSGLEGISSWSSNDHATFDASKIFCSDFFETSLNIRTSALCLCSFEFRRLFLLVYPLVLYYDGPPLYLSFFLTVRLKLVWCPAPDVSLPQLIFSCVMFKSIPHLNIKVTWVGSSSGSLFLLDRVQFRAIWLIDDSPLKSIAYHRVVTFPSFFQR